MTTYNADIGWINGNARLENLSGKFLAAHIGQIALMAFWAGAFTIFEVTRYNPDIPVYEQGLICIPQLARLGWGIGSGGVIVDSYPYFVIGVLHLIGCSVYAAGALYHAVKGPGDLSSSDVARTANFHFDWDDSKKSGFVLGHHLIFIGVACLLFVFWAATYGIYDPAIGEVRTVAPDFNPVKIFKYGWAARGYNPFLVSDLGDVMGGHLFIGSLEIAGGLFHIVVPPFDLAKRIFVQSGEGQLSFALAGLAVMGFNAAYYTAVNDVVFPVELFGPVLETKLSVTPYFADTIESVGGNGHTARFWIANFHFFLAFMNLQGHLWHALRASGFDFNRVPQAFSALTPD